MIITNALSEVYKDATFQVLGLSNQTLEDSFDHLVYTLERFQCSKAIDEDVQQEARKLLCGTIFSYIRRMERAVASSMDEKEEQEDGMPMVQELKQEYHALCQRYQAKFNVPVSALFTIEPSPRDGSAMVMTAKLSWSQELDAFWAHAHNYYERIRSQSSDTAERLPRYAQLVATFFLERRVPLPLSPDVLTAQQRLVIARSMLDKSVLTSSSDDKAEPISTSNASTGTFCAPPVDDNGALATAMPRIDQRPVLSATRRQLSAAPSTAATSSNDIAPPVFATINREPIVIPSFTENHEPAEPQGPIELSFTALAAVGPLTSRVETMDVVEDGKGR